MSRVRLSLGHKPVAPEDALRALEASDLDYFGQFPFRRRRLRWIDAAVLNAYMCHGENTWRFLENGGWECAPWPRFSARTRAFMVSDYEPQKIGGQITQRVFAISGARLLEMERITFGAADLRRRRSSVARPAP